MANVKDNVAAKETKRKLIDAAGVVFAEKGFERATIKDITAAAGASMAAVNYHFSDKNELYYQCIRHAHAATSGAFEAVKNYPPEMPPEDKLRKFIHSLLEGMLDPSLPKWHATLIWREMQQPTAAIERLISETFNECCGGMEELIRPLVHRSISQEQLDLIVESVIGQCLFHVHHQEFHARVFPEQPPAYLRVDELAEHIADFSLAAIGCLYGEGAPVTNGRAR